MSEIATPHRPRSSDTAPQSRWREAFLRGAGASHGGEASQEFKRESWMLLIDGGRILLGGVLLVTATEGKVWWALAGAVLLLSGAIQHFGRVRRRVKQDASHAGKPRGVLSLHFLGWAALFASLAGYWRGRLFGSPPTSDLQEAPIPTKQEVESPSVALPLEEASSLLGEPQQKIVILSRFPLGHLGGGQRAEQLAQCMSATLMAVVVMMRSRPIVLAAPA